MGWEVRHNGRRYLYRNRRVNGEPVKEYLAADDRFGFGDVMADDLERVRRREATVRALERRARADFRTRVDRLLGATEAANDTLRVVVEGVLCAAGYHRHHRGEWRMKKILKQLRAQIDQLRAVPAKLAPLVSYTAPAGDTEAVAVYQKARTGDPTAQEEVRALIVARGWVNWVGDLGRQATHQLIHQAAGGDPVWKAGVTEKVLALRKELLGDAPSVLDELLVRRVVNGWVTVHALELESAVRPPADRRLQDHVDKALTRAQKRMAEAVRELARVRRLQLPGVLARLAVITTPGESPVEADQAGLSPPGPKQLPASEGG